MSKEKNNQKTISLSVRVPQQDAMFLNKVEIDGAITPSEKLRAILNATRRREEGLGSYEETLKIFNEILQPALKELRSYERTTKAHSEVLRTLSEWLPETASFLASALLKHDEEKSNDTWIDVESGVVQRVMTLMQSILRMGVTPRCNAYDPEVISKQIDPIVELALVVKDARNN